MLLLPQSGGHRDHRRSRRAAAIVGGSGEDYGRREAPEEEEDDDKNDDDGGCLGHGLQRILPPRPWRGTTTTTMTMMYRHLLVMRSKTFFFLEKLAKHASPRHSTICIFMCRYRKMYYWFTATSFLLFKYSPIIAVNLP